MIRSAESRGSARSGRCTGGNSRYMPSGSHAGCTFLAGTPRNGRRILLVRDIVCLECLMATIDLNALHCIRDLFQNGATSSQDNHPGSFPYQVRYPALQTARAYHEYLGTAIVHFEQSMVKAAKASPAARPAAQVRIRRMLHPFGSETGGEHPDATAAGCLLLVSTRRFGWREWHRYLDRKTQTALSLLWDMPEGTVF